MGWAIFGLPFHWGFLLGFVLGAVSPAVVVPCMMDLQQAKLGTEKGIPSLVIAAASIDDVLAITGFTITLTLIGSQESEWLHVIKGPSEAVIGICLGILFGMIFWYLPYGLNTKLRAPAIVLLCWRIILDAYSYGFPGAGQTASLTLPFVAAIRWRKKRQLRQVEDVLQCIWSVFEPLLFVTIGAEIKLHLLKTAILTGGSCVILGIIIRCLVAYNVVGGSLTRKEKLFITIAWLPKATVQAAIGSVALEWALKAGDQEAIKHGNTVLTIAALSILMTAPLGAVAIKLAAPRLLQSEPSVDLSSPSATNLKTFHPADHNQPDAIDISVISGNGNI